MNLIVDGRAIPIDKEGYLKNLHDWDKAVARKIAQEEHIILNESHWEIIDLLREFYQEFEIPPAMRALVKRTAQKLGEEKGRSVYLMQLFPPSPARIGCKIAGLPRPANCL
jgi:tRNA 2-thiouridine synthesizing protein E